MKPLVAKVKTEMFLLITSKKKAGGGGDEKDTKSRTFGDLGVMILHLKSSQAVLHAGCEEFE